jgi:hypothetical protein
MPNSGGAPSSHPQAPTHHQLDELDALMQRMLALPVDEFDSAPDSPAELLPAEQKRDDCAQASTEIGEDYWRAATPVGDQSSTSQEYKSRTILAHSETIAAQGGAEESDDELMLPAVPAEAWTFPALGPTMPERIEPASPLSEWEDLQRKNGDTSNEESLAVLRVDKPPVELTTQYGSESQPYVSFPGMNPLLLINWVYDRVLALFGSNGLWLRSPGGRNLVGLLGLVLALGSIAWLLWGMMAWNW